MAYEKTIWKDRAVEKPRTFNIVNNPDGTITLIPAPGIVVEEGTPVNSANMNRIEVALEGHSSQMADLEQSLIIGLDGKLDKPVVFGDGRDGDFNSTGDVIFDVIDDIDPPIIKQYRNFTLNAGHIMTTSGRSKGIIILCTGDVTINGTIDMNNKAARIVRTTPPAPNDTLFNENNFKSFIALPIMYEGEKEYPNVGSSQLQYIILPAGGIGGGSSVNTAFGGSGGAGGRGGYGGSYGGGGGGGGGAGNGGTGGNGGKGNGGAGSGGNEPTNGGTGGAGAGLGGSGGAGGSQWSGESGGGPGQSGLAGGPGGGGIIVIIAKGKITVTGTLTAKSTGSGGNGGSGGYGANSSVPGSGGKGGNGGGGAGGGVIALVSSSEVVTDNSIINVDGSPGGKGGTGYMGGSNNGTDGADGQIGTIITEVIGE